MDTTSTPNSTAVNDAAKLKEIHNYLQQNYPLQLAKIEAMMGKTLNIDMREVIGKTVIGLPMGVAGKLALTVVVAGLKWGVYALDRSTMAPGETRYSPASDPDNYVGYLFYTWKENGTPSFHSKF